MRFVLFLLLAIAANSVWANAVWSPAPSSKAVQVSSPSTVFEALQAATPDGGRCGEATHLALWSPAEHAAGTSDAYCSRMAQCCATGTSSCCVNYSKYCNK